MLDPMTAPLPIHAIRADFAAAFDAGPVVVSSPTGSGKSTEIPRWLADAGHRVIVVEPRRVACRALASRVAELEGTVVGEGVGYAVRDDARYGDHTRILFATSGLVLRSESLLRRADVVVLDELHERSLDLDFLLALLADLPSGPRLVAMSATLDGERIAGHLRGTHVTAEGRAHPVSIHHVGPASSVPTVEALPARVLAAVERAAADMGDVLVFLPGKGEIDACARALSGGSFDVVPLHGGLSMEEQRRAFRSQIRRKVVLATNVAETSITIPGIGVVIDAGLVRRTRYHQGRSFLSLMPIAEDSATQRAGRAGRTGPGVAYRLWGASANLPPATPPAIHRESLVPLVMHAARWGVRTDTARWLDAPKPYALSAARDELRALRAIDGDEAFTHEGRAVAELPVEANLARILVEAHATGTVEVLDDAIDLVAALSVERPLLARATVDGNVIREGDCDVRARVRAVRIGAPDDGALVWFSILEARKLRERLRRTFGLPVEGPVGEVDRPALLRVAVAADPRSAYVTRIRGRTVALANGGTELELARESLAALAAPPEAVVVFESRAFGSAVDARIVVTCCSPIGLDALARAGLGDERLASVAIDRGKVVATLERRLAGKVLATRTDVPTGALAREAFATLYLRGSLFREAKLASEERIALAVLAAALGPSVVGEEVVPVAPDLAAFAEGRVANLGIESGEDLALLAPKDLLAPDVPYLVRQVLERDYPRKVDLGDATYRVEYDVPTRRAMLTLTRGTRKDPPPLSYLPKFPGLGIVVSSPSGSKVLRARG